ncbi:MAG: helix-hairpin-helix domain-containing protein [Ignavibacteria bacterium]|nr:helix-hairpin-helix domain-containing protein [Ignavibacteria bacterium]
MITRCRVWPCLFLLTWSVAAAQEGSIDELIPMDEMDEGTASQLQWILDHPYDLNQVTPGQLGFIPGVSSVDAARIVRYRNHHGPFRTVSELDAVEGLTDGTAETLRPFVIVPERSDTRMKAFSADLRARAVRDMQTRRGFAEGAYLGSPEKLNLRVLAEEAGGFAGGMLMEKDAGEPESLSFVTGHLSYHDPGNRSRIVAGDYRIETGQGLVLWNGSGRRGSDPAVSPFRKARGIVPHRSADETGFFRGIAAETQFGGGSFSLLGFASRRFPAGTADSAGKVLTVDETGLYRTQAEREKRGIFCEDIVGVGIRFVPDAPFSLGFASYRSAFLHRETGKGETRIVAGLSGGFRSDEYELLWEIAGTADGAAAVVIGTEVVPAQTVSLVMSYRGYQPSFLNDHAGGFGTRSDSRNEEGMHLGILLRPARGIRLSLGFEQVRFPESTGSAVVATSGIDFVGQLALVLTRDSDMEVRFQTGKREENGTLADLVGRDVRLLADERYQRARFTLTHLAMKGVRFRSRVELVGIPGTPVKSAESGMLVYQDCRFRSNFGLNVDARVIFFHTDSFRSRIYAFENDVRGSFSVPPLFGKGMRWYLLLQYEPAPGFRIAVRYAETWKEGVTELGSGWGTIKGDLDNDLTIQVDLSL